MSVQHKKSDQSLYFWAILPPSELAAEVDALRHECSRRFDTKRALRLPVHLTLYPPFRIGKEDFLLMKEKVREWLEKQNSFEVELDGFGFFNRRNPVAFVHVSKTPALLAFEKTFQKMINVLLDIKEEQGEFNPHLTIAQQDLDRKQLPAMKEFLSGKSFRAAFEVHELCLFRHDGRAWKVAEKFALGGR